jgi:hypothetical protein
MNPSRRTPRPTTRPWRLKGDDVISTRLSRARRWAPGLLLLLAAAPVAALDYLVSAGPSLAGGNDTTGALYIDVVGKPRPVDGPRWDWQWQPIVSLGAIHSRRGDTELDRHVVIGSIGLRLLPYRKLFMSMQFGYANTRTAAVSSHEQFVSDIGWSFGRTALSLRHISNGHLFGGRNRGETMLLFGLDF